ISGGVVNVPTSGGTAADPLIVSVSGLNPAIDVITISVGPNACPTISGVGGAPTSSFSVSGSDSTATFYCVVPPGQGSSNPVLVTHTEAGVSYSALTNSVSYAAPTVTAFASWQTAAGDWVAYPLTDPQAPPTVRVPTAGSRIQARGANLGVAPLLT